MDENKTRIKLTDRILHNISLKRQSRTWWDLYFYNHWGAHIVYVWDDPNDLDFTGTMLEFTDPQHATEFILKYG